MLVLVDVGDVEAEEGVWEPGRDGRVREVGVDDEDGDKGENDAKAQAEESPKRIGWPKDPVVVRIEEVAVLL